MIITADLAHRPIPDLELALAYYNKIFRRISGPPKWLTRNLRQAFETVETARPPTDYDGDIKKGDAWLRELYLY